jgi:alpha-beta hydrolase superfamily lysophospholipase
VTGFDCRGHGRSQGRHGYVRRFSDYVDDLDLVLAAARRASPGLPVAIVAHSHGATISLAYLLGGRGTVDALAITAPYLALRMKVPFYKRVMSPIMGALWPTLTMWNEIGPEVTARSPAAQAQMIADPLIRHVATPRWFNEVRAAQASVLLRAAALKVPTLMSVAGDDRLVDAEVSLAFARAAGPVIEVKVYDGLFHEVYLEPEWEMVIADIIAWLGRRFDGTT